MARDYAAIYTSVWADPHWTKLTPELQHTYWLVLSQPRLSPCGVLDWIPSRYRHMAAGLTPATLGQRVEALAATQPRPWLIVDLDTCELLVRSFVKWDSLITGARPAKAIAKDWASIASETIRHAVVCELHERFLAAPKLAGWKGIGEANDDLLQAIVGGAEAA